MRVCRVCIELKDLSEFEYYRPGSLRRQCRDCRLGIKNVQRQEGWGWAVSIVNSAKNRAKKRGWAFNITPEWVLSQYTGICPVFGIPLKRNKGLADDSPTLDRVDNSRGYTKDNVIIVSMKANRSKNSLSLNEIEQLFNYYRTHHAHSNPGASPRAYCNQVNALRGARNATG